MIGLNLLPEVKKEFIKAQRTRNTVVSLAIVTMIVAGGVTAFLGVFVYGGQLVLMNLTKDNIKKNQASLEKKPEIGKYLTVQNQLDALATLHDKDHKSIYSRIFGFLQALNPAAPNSVSLGSSKILKQGQSIEIQGVTSNFRSLDVFKNTLQKAKLTYELDEKSKEVPLFSEVVLKSANLAKDAGKAGVAFEFTLTYSQEAFRPDVTNMQLVVPKQTISDAQVNAPSELFNSTGGTQ